MHPSALRLALCSSLVLAVAPGCGGSETDAPALDTRPIVGLMELPIAHRNDGTMPADALRIEISPSELRLDSQPIYTLERGRVPDAEVTPDGLTRLTEAVRNAPARGRASITAHSLVSYGTAVRVVQSLLVAGYREVAFAVRQHSPTGAPPAAASWLTISAPQIAPSGREVLDPATYGGAGRPWSDFVTKWEDVYGACRAGSYIDCDPVALAPAPGGSLQVVLWARGQGMQIRFNRVGEPVPEAAQPNRPALIEGVRAAVPAGDEEVPPDPSVSGAFAFRANVATDPESVLASVTRPVCGATPCQVVVEADDTTPMMRVLPFLGAAFPNGTPAPQLVFRLPR